MNNVLITGGSGMVGNAVKNILPDAIYVSSKDYNLLKEDQVENMFNTYRPEYVIHLAARVGGVKANPDLFLLKTVE